MKQSQKTAQPTSKPDKKQHLAGDELEGAIVNELAQPPRGKTVPQVARAIGAPMQTVRYRLFQLAAAGVVRGEWRRRFLFYYLSESKNDTAPMNSEKTVFEDGSKYQSNKVRSREPEPEMGRHSAPKGAGSASRRVI